MCYSLSSTLVIAENDHGNDHSFRLQLLEEGFSPQFGSRIIQVYFVELDRKEEGIELLNKGRIGQD